MADKLLKVSEFSTEGVLAKIPDSSLSIAKTDGLQDALDGPSALDPAGYGFAGATITDLLALADTAAIQFGVASAGDSYAQSPDAQFGTDFGITGKWFSAWECTFGGGATYTVPGFTASLNSAVVDLTSAQTVAMPTGIVAGVAKVVYQVSPSGGTFKIQTDDDNNGTWTDRLTVDSSISVNGANAAALAQIDITARFHRVRAIGVSGTSRILTLGLDGGDLSAGAGRHGIVQFGYAASGTTITSMATTPQHIFDAHFGGTYGLRPRFIFYKCDDGAAAFQASFGTLVGKIRTAFPNVVIVLQGRHPTTGAPLTTLHEDDIALKTLCDSLSCIYVPTRLYFPNAADSQAAGILRTDDGGVHLTARGAVLQDTITYNYLHQITEAILPHYALGNSAKKRLLNGVSGVDNTYGSYLPDWTVRGNLDTNDSNFGIYNMGGDSPSNNPGAFTGWFFTKTAAGLTHTGGAALKINDLTREYINQSGNAIRGGGNYSPNNITNTMAAVHTVLSGGDAAKSGIILGTVATPDSGSYPLQLRKSVAYNADGTQTMRMSNESGKLNYLGGGADAVTGAFTLESGVATINTTSVATNDHVNVAITTPGGTMGNHYKITIVNGTSITITAINTSGATVTTDTSAGTWEIAKGRF